MDMMEKRKKKNGWVKWAVTAVILALGAALIVPNIMGNRLGAGSAGSFQNADAAGALPDAGASGSQLTAGEYVSASRGDITVKASGDGSLAAKTKKSVYTETSGKVDQLNVEAGDRVSEGDVLAVMSSDDLESDITSMQSSLFSAQVALSDVRDKGKDYYIYAPAAGTLKVIYAEEDDDIATLMRTQGVLAVISRDDKMRVEFVPGAEAISLKVGDAVSVWQDDKEIQGTVDELTNDTMVVSFPDDDYDVGEQVQVTTLQGAALGGGVTKINMPVPVTGIGGTIDTVYYDENDSVASGAKLFYITGRIPSSELQSALLTYDDARTSLDNALKEKEGLVVRAPISGVVTEVNAEEGEAVAENLAIVRIQSIDSFELVASIDELDIADIEVGQPVAVTVDAREGKTYSGTVASISDTGTVNNGVASFDVKIQLNESEGLKSGMSASAEITVAEKKDVIRVPVEAVSTSGGQEYVTLSSGGTAQVTTGASDGEYVEIVSGLDEGERVLITRERDDGAASSPKSLGMGMRSFS
jgi:HlyD family secretion protein